MTLPLPDYVETLPEYPSEGDVSEEAILARRLLSLAINHGTLTNQANLAPHYYSSRELMLPEIRARITYWLDGKVEFEIGSDYLFGFGQSLYVSSEVPAHVLHYLFQYRVLEDLAAISDGDSNV